MAREYIVKRKSYLTQWYLPPPSYDVTVGDGDAGQTTTTASVDKIVTALLQEHDGLKHVLNTITPALVPLVRRYFTMVYIDSVGISHRDFVISTHNSVKYITGRPFV